jgi:hypothetical protein
VVGAGASISKTHKLSQRLDISRALLMKSQSNKKRLSSFECCFSHILDSEGNHTGEYDTYETAPTKPAPTQTPTVADEVGKNAGAKNANGSPEDIQYRLKLTASARQHC